MLCLMKEVRWSDSILEFDVTRVVKKTIYGELRIPGCDSTINSSLLHQYWRFATGPALPEVRCNFIMFRFQTENCECNRCLSRLASLIWSVL